ncbi:LuxR family transcriptional regulator [Phytomonospora sp. NPDC050363]|uniref:LuxR family transcriptional regulator n=1 Tax=Phytomonospora sp. NPDC050363 TaxID=3155642 RepID=UPI0033E528FE
MGYGRDLERNALAEVVTATRGGQGGVLVVRGEAGIGKTTLIDRAVEDVPRVLRVRGVESEVELAFSGLHRLLTPLRSEVDSLPRNRAEALRAALDGDGPATDLRVCAAAHELLTTAAEREPLLIVADDAQHLDRASLAVLLFCARRLTGTSLGILMAVRDPGRRAVDTHDLPELRLTGLDRDEAAALIGDVADAGTLELLLDTARGNPLALTRLAAADPSRLTADALLTGSVPVDDVLRRVFRDRFDALPEPERRSLLVAAADDTGRAEIIAAAREQLGLPEVPGEFEHPLARSVAYHAATGPDRRAAHAALAAAVSEVDEHVRARRHRALATERPDENLAAALERDARADGGRGSMAATTSALLHAARLSTRPADRARRIAHAAHTAWKSGHPTLARSLVESAERAGAGGVELIRLRGLIDLHSGHRATAYAELVRGAANLRRHGHLDQAAELSFMAVDAALHADMRDEAVAAATGVAETHPDPAYRRYGRWLATAATGRFDASAADPWAVHDAAPATIARSGAHRWIFPLAIGRGSSDPRRAREFALTACEQMRATGMLALCATPTLWLAELEHRLGMWTEALEHAREGLALARDSGQPVTEADLLALLALLHADRGELAEAERCASRALDLARAHGNRLAAARATWASGRAAALRGDAARPVELLAAIGSGRDDRGHRAVRAESLPDAVEAAVRCGSAPAPEPGVDGPEWTVELALALSGCEPERRFLHALSLLDGAERPYELARAALAYGRWLRRARRPRDAREPLRRAARLFDELGAVPWATSARDELRACGDAVPRAATAAAGLTSRELTVAALAARGLSNREIGARLFLSPRTVGYHLAKVFTKVGVSARGQLRGVDLSSAAKLPAT